MLAVASSGMTTTVKNSAYTNTGSVTNCKNEYRTSKMRRGLLDQKSKLWNDSLYATAPSVAIHTNSPNANEITLPRMYRMPHVRTTRLQKKT